MKMHDRLPLVLRPHRLRLLALMCTSVLFGAVGFLFPSHSVAAYLWIGFWVFGLLLYGALLLPNLAYLRLSEDGFAWRWLRSKRFIAWSDVDRFVVAPGYRGQKFVGWYYVRRYVALPSTRGDSYRLTGGEGYLPDTYGMKAEKLADLMNSLRARFGRAEEDEDA